MNDYLKICGIISFSILGCSGSQEVMKDYIIPTDIKIDSIVIEPHRAFIDDKIYYVSPDKILNQQNIELLRNDINNAIIEQIKFAPKCQLIFYSAVDSIALGFTPPDLIKYDGLTYKVKNHILKNVVIKKK